MKKFFMNAKTANKAELTLRGLSDKAYEAYRGTDPMTFYEWDGKLYEESYFPDGATLEEVNEYLEDLANELDD